MYGVVCLIARNIWNICLWQHFSRWHIWILPAGWVNKIVQLVRGHIHFQRDGAPPTLLSACEGVLTGIFLEPLDRSWQNPCIAPKVTRPYTTWLLSLRLHEGIIIWIKGWFKNSTAPSYICSHRAHTPLHHLPIPTVHAGKCIATS